MNKVLYIGIRCLKLDIDGTAWNHHLEILRQVFRDNNLHVDYVDITNRNVKKNILFKVLKTIIYESIKRKRLIPFQEIIYINDRYIREKEYKYISDSDYIFIEGVRSCFAIEDIIRIIDISKKRIICDMDDLISERYKNMLKNNIEITFGYETKTLNKITKLINLPIIRRLFLLYEFIALRMTEKKLLSICNEITLVSEYESSILKQVYIKNKQAKIHTTLSFDPYFDEKDFIDFKELKKFIFIGSDRQLQNKTSIDNLIKIWEKYNIPYIINIYGKMYYKYKTNNDNIKFNGFVENLDECYSKGSVLINLTEIKGGIKIKTVQSIIRGIPVIGFKNAFDGLPKWANTIKINNIYDMNNLLSSKNINSCIQKQYNAQKMCKEGFINRQIVLKKWERVFSGH